MQSIESISEMKAWSRARRRDGESIGLVPTMGFLHAGHMSLVEASLRRCDRTVVSIFVNPIQFGPGEDFDTYPRDLERDRRLLESAGVDVLFVPRREVLYPPGFATRVRVERLTDSLCGKSRPGFFEGVATVVLKLFHCVEPDRAFFGEKDRQQLEVVRALVRDLNLDIDIVGLPIVREPDGLAQSSRNAYLEPGQRQAARSLFRALESGRELIRRGERSAEAVRRHMQQIIETQPGARIDYVSVCDPRDFAEQETINGRAVLALAVHIGNARLIDNCLVETNGCNESC